MTSVTRPGVSARVAAEDRAKMRTTHVRDVKTNPHGVLPESPDD